MTSFDIGGPQFGNRECRIGKWVGDGTYTPQQVVKAVRIFAANMEITSQDLDGDDSTTATATTIKKGTITLAMGSIQLPVVTIISGNPVVDSGALQRLRITTRKPPYIGISGRALAAEGDGDTHLFVPKCKMTGGFEVRFEIDTFAIPSITLTAVADDNFVDTDGYPVIYDIDEHETATAAVLPPTGMLS